MLLRAERAASDSLSQQVAVGQGRTLYLKYNTKDEFLHGEVLNILRAYSGNIPVVVRCLATGEAVSPKDRVRPCQAVNIELISLLGSESVLMK